MIHNKKANEFDYSQNGHTFIGQFCYIMMYLIIFYSILKFLFLNIYSFRTAIKNNNFL